MIVETQLAEHFALGFREYDYVGHAPEFWAFRGRMFGGYTAAASLLAAARWAPEDSVALTATFSYLSAAEVGPYRIEPTNVRLGRTSSAVNVHMVQGTHTRATLSTWFVRPDALPQARSGGTGFTAREPEGTLKPTWRDQKNPFDSAYQRHGVHYPETRADYPSHGSSIDMWIRLVDCWQSDSPLHRQAADLLILDAHMAETLVDTLRADPLRSYSIDLAVRWSEAVLAELSTSGWRRLVARGEAGGRIGVTTAELLHGPQVAAEATQHVAIGPSRDV